MSKPNNEVIRADCERIAEVAHATDSLSLIAERLTEQGVALSREAVRRRVRAMARELGLSPANPAEKAAARWLRETAHQAGAVVHRWRRHCL